MLFNTRVQNDSAFFTALDNLGWQALAAVSVWPTNDLFDAVLSYAAWRPRHFTPAELADPLTSGDAADGDADGLANDVEFAMGLGLKEASPTNRPSFAMQMLDSVLYPTLTFRRLLLAHEADYLVEVSSDLVNWSATPHQVGTPRLNTDGTQTVTFRDAVPAYSETARCMRLKIARQAN